MLQKLSDQVRACHERAEEAARRSAEASDPALKADYLVARDRWLALADSYDLTASVSDFIAAGAAGKTGASREARGQAREDHHDNLLRDISTSLIRDGDINSLYERLLDGAISLMNSDFGSMQVYDRDRDELGLLAWRGFHPESAAFWYRIGLGSGHSSCAVALKSGRRIIVPDAENCEFMAGSADLDYYRLSGIRAVQSTPLLSRSGELLGMISTHWREPHHPPESALRLLDVLARQGADLIERTRAESQIVMLAREAEHRARNVLATVRATVQLSQADTPQGLKQSILGRIDALANVHRLFVASRWRGADLRTIALNELSPYRRESEGQVQIDGASVTVKPDIAQAVAIVLHELATNAAKYGSLSVIGGRVRVSWPDALNERLILRWTETGGPPAHPPVREGFGTGVMKGMINALRGQMNFDWREDGLVCQISIPI